MEAQKFEELEGVDQEEGYVPEEEPAMKEYEKLLLAENNRELYLKATKLIQFGCFDQKEIPAGELDFGKYTKIENEKKYKGLYTLYQNNDTMELIFVCPLVENNKGDSADERANMKPYAFDVLAVETMDEETFQLVCKAAKNNIHTYISTLVVVAWVAYGLLLAIGTYAVLSNLFYYVDDYSLAFFKSLGLVFANNGAILGSEAVALPLLVLMSIKYKKYKDK